MSDRIEIEKDLPFARPIFTEEEVQLLCRNSSEILAFHERFVDDLKEALAPLGSKFRFDSEDEYAYVDMPRYDTLELAIEIIVSMFVDRVSSQFPPFSSTSPLTSCIRPRLNLSSSINSFVQPIPRPLNLFNVQGRCLRPIGSLGRNDAGDACLTIISADHRQSPALAQPSTLNWVILRLKQNQD